MIGHALRSGATSLRPPSARSTSSEPTTGLFSLRFEFMQLGEVGLGMLEGTTNRFWRTSQHVAAFQNDDFVLGVNRGRSHLVISHVGHESTLKPGMACFSTTPNRERFAAAPRIPGCPSQCHAGSSSSS